MQKKKIVMLLLHVVFLVINYKYFLIKIAIKTCDKFYIKCFEQYMKFYYPVWSNNKHYD